MSTTEPTRESADAAFLSEVYPLDVLKRAAYRFTNRAAFDFRVEGPTIICKLSFAKPLQPQEADSLLFDFRNEVLDQDLRRSIAEETAGTRNAILAFAFSQTGLQGDK